MTKYHETKALVLHSMPIGESDKRLLLLTKEYGKVVAFARGAKKASSKFLAGSEIFAYGDYSLYKGKSAYNVTEIRMIDSFRHLTKDIEVLSYGLYILEVVEHVCVEGAENVEIMELALRTLKAIEKGIIDLPFILRVFQLKILVYLGFMPLLESCVLCGATEGLNHFYIKEGGLVCKHCYEKGYHTRAISNNTVKIMNYIIQINLKELYHFKVSEQVFNEMSDIIEKYFEFQIPKKFNALDLVFP